MSDIDKKVRFIKAWYKNECSKLSFSDRLRLARVWVNICLRDEEYEMASALKDERKKVIKKHIKDKRSKKRVSQRIIIWLYLFKRKVSVWLKNKL